MYVHFFFWIVLKISKLLNKGFLVLVLDPTKEAVPCLACIRHYKHITHAIKTNTSVNIFSYKINY